MSQQENIDATQRMDETVNSGNLKALTEAIAPEVVDHVPAPGQVLVRRGSYSSSKPFARRSRIST
jgi:hypothetical protein